MTVAYYCVLFAFVMPLIFTIYAKFTSGFTPRDNHQPREFLAALEGKAKRAHWAQQNTMEALPAFFAAVIIAHQLHAPQSRIDFLAVGFILLRLIYGVCYIMDWASIRSLVWTLGMACTMALVLIAA